MVVLSHLGALRATPACVDIAGCIRRRSGNKEHHDSTLSGKRRGQTDSSPHRNRLGNGGARLIALTMKETQNSYLRRDDDAHIAIREYLDSVPWWLLFDAYGCSKPLKKSLLDLHIGNADEKDAAIYDGLWSRAIHQSTYYTSTIFVVPAVVMALRDGIRHETQELLAFLCECVEIGTYRLRWRFTFIPVSVVRLLQLPFLLRVGLPSLEHEIPKARCAYEELLRSEEPHIRDLAQRLLSFCSTELEAG